MGEPMTRVWSGVLAAVGLAASTGGVTACAANRAAADGTSAESAARSAPTGPSAGGAPVTATGVGGAGTAAPSASGGDGSRSEQFDGRVERVDKGDHVTIAGSESAGLAFQPFKLEPGTEVVKDGRKASASDLEEGDEVRATLAGTGDELRLERIEILRPAAGGGGTAPPQVDQKQETGGK
jgi:hypothetical protein